MFGFLRKEDGHLNEASLIAVFRIYLITISGIYFIGAILELLINFKSASIYTFVVLTVIPLIFLALSYLGVRHRTVLLLNMISIFVINQIQISLNPKAYHVLVYWIALMPLMVTVLMQRVRDTIIWTIMLIIFILVNGLYVSKTYGPYPVTIYPERFIAGGFLFALLTCSVAAIFSYVQTKSRRALVTQNDTLSGLKSQLEEQRDQLNLKNERLECYIKSILELSQSEEVIHGEYDRAVQRICQSLSENMGITQVSYWTYEEYQNTITRRYVFPAHELQTLVLDLNNFPRYATRLKAKKIIAAKNAVEDPSTSEFGGDYLRKQNIMAMLDSPLVINGQLVGIICCEERNERTWNAEDLLVVSAACDILTISLKAMQHKQYIKEIEGKNIELSNQAEEITLINEKLKGVNEHLEERVAERTFELEEQNKQLSEYAFINAHLLRAPLSSILGLIHVLHASDLSKKEAEVIRHLYDSGMKLDEIIHRIADTLEKGNQLNRRDISNKNKIHR